LRLAQPNVCVGWPQALLTVAGAVVGCGGSVAMLARRRDRLDELEEELGGRAVGIRADITDLGDLEADHSAVAASRLPPGKHR